MTTSNTIRTPYLQYLINTSPLAKRIEDIIGTDKFEELLKADTICQFICEEKLLMPTDICAFIAALEIAERYSAECDMYNYEFGDAYPSDTNHYRKNKARRHRKALKNEKRGVYHSVSYSDPYDKLKKRAQLEHAKRQDVINQAKEYYNSSSDEVNVIPPISIPTTPETPFIPSTETTDIIFKGAFKKGYTAGYDDGYENGQAVTRSDNYELGFKAGYAAAMQKVKKELEKLSTSL